MSDRFLPLNALNSSKGQVPSQRYTDNGDGTFSPQVAIGGSSGGSGVALAAGEAHVGQVGGHTIRANAAFVRPADVVPYAIGDLVGNAGAVVPMQFDIGRTVTGGGMVRRARLRKTGISIANAVFRLHLYVSAPATVPGDNAIWLTSGAASYVGSIDIACDKQFTDGAAGNGIPTVGSEINFTSQVYFGLLEARGAFVPASGESFTITLEVLQN